jgi:hypothetical protein
MNVETQQRTKRYIKLNDAKRISGSLIGNRHGANYNLCFDGIIGVAYNEQNSTAWISQGAWVCDHQLHFTIYAHGGRSPGA